MPRPYEPDLVTAAVASRFTQYTPRTLRRYVAQGRLTRYRMGPHGVRYDMRELRKLAVAMNTYRVESPASDDIHAA